MFDTVDKIVLSVCLALIVVFGYFLYQGAEERSAYSNLCKSKGGEVIYVSSSPNLCRDGNTLINVYKESAK